MSKITEHSYANDSLLCIDKSAANRIMAERFEMTSRIADLTTALQITDSVAYNRGIVIDTLLNKNYRQDINYKACETQRINDANKYTQTLKTNRKITWLGWGVAIIVAIIKFK